MEKDSDTLGPGLRARFSCHSDKGLDRATRPTLAQRKSVSALQHKTLVRSRKGSRMVDYKYMTLNRSPIEKKAKAEKCNLLYSTSTSTQFPDHSRLLFLANQKLTEQSGECDR
jgi:hypothetical protein